MDERVKGYIERMGSPQKEMCIRLRSIILQTFPGIDERMMYGVPWYGKFYIAGMKDSVNLGFSVEGLSEEDLKNFKGSGKLMRHRKFREMDEIDEAEIVRLLKMVDERSECRI